MLKTGFTASMMKEWSSDQWRIWLADNVVDEDTFALFVLKIRLLDRWRISKIVLGLLKQICLDRKGEDHKQLLKRISKLLINRGVCI